MIKYIRISFFSCAIFLGILGMGTGNLLYMLGACLSIFLALVGTKKFEMPRIEAIKIPIWLMTLGTSVLFSVMAALSARDAPENLFAGILWILALLGAILAGWLHDRTVVGRTAIRSSEPEEVVQEERQKQLQKKWFRWEIGLIALFTIVAFILRVYQVSTLPPLHGDEGEMGDLALQILQGEPLPPFITLWLDHPTLFHYLQAGSIWFFRRFFEQDVIGLRLLSSIFGALCVPVIYSLARQGWGRMAGLTAAWLLTISHFHIHYSRIGLNNIQSVWATIFFLTLLATVAKGIIARRAKSQPSMSEQPEYQPSNEQKNSEGNQFGSATTLLSRLRTSRGPISTLPQLYIPFISTGLVAGVAQYLYFGSRLILVLWIPLLAYLWWRRAANLRQIALSLTCFLIAYLPIIPHFLQKPVTFNGRTNGVTIFDEKNMHHLLGPDAQWPQDMVKVLWMQLEQNLRFFVDFGDLSAFYYPNIPGFDPVTAFLFWLGLGLALTKMLRYHEFSILLWFSTGILLAGVLTNDSPNGPRLIVMASSVFVIAGIFTQALYNLFWASSRRVRHTLFATILLTIILSTTWLNLNMYFITYAKAQPRSLSFAIAQEMMIAPENYDTYLMGTPNLYAEYGTIRFIARAAKPQNLDDVDALLQIQQARIDSDSKETDLVKPGLLVILLTHKLDQLPLLEEQFPGGLTKTHDDVAGHYLFTSYRVPLVE